MIEFLKENYNVEVSKSTVRRVLIESNYSYSDPKIRPNNTDKEKIKMVKETIFQNWTQVFFSDETKIYLENPREFKWIHNEDEYAAEI